MPLKYTRAPISELVCGINFNSNILLTNGVLFRALTELSKDFPIINTHPTITEEEVINDTIQAGTDYAKAGFATYRLIAAEGTWHILLQQNLLTVHWVRQDFEDVGNYPGFDAVFEKFKGIYSIIRSLFANSQQLDSQIKNYYLTYADRVKMDEFREQGMSIDDVINLNPPFFDVNGRRYFANNYFARYSIPCDAIDGYSIVSVNSPTLPNLGQILAVDNKLKGYSPRLASVDDWFPIAHDIQVSFFEALFKPEILKKWQ